MKHRVNATFVSNYLTSNYLISHLFPSNFPTTWNLIHYHLKLWNIRNNDNVTTIRERLKHKGGETRRKGIRQLIVVKGKACCRTQSNVSPCTLWIAREERLSSSCNRRKFATWASEAASVYVLFWNLSETRRSVRILLVARRNPWSRSSRSVSTPSGCVSISRTDRRSNLPMQDHRVCPESFVSVSLFFILFFRLLTRWQNLMYLIYLIYILPREFYIFRPESHKDWNTLGYNI